jgi:hypothetical protein
VAKQQAGKKPDTTITAAKIALIGTISAAFIGAAATVTVALLQHKSSDQTAENPAALFPTSTSADLAIKVFDESALESDDGIKKILVEDYKMRAETVNCPADQEVRAGNKFTCVVRIGEGDFKELAVTITVVNDSGEYQVGLPE